jgi:hypothetical protein
MGFPGYGTTGRLLGQRCDGVGRLVTREDEFGRVVRGRPNADESAQAAPDAVLVVGTDDWGIQQAVDQLEAAGLRALTCHPPGEPAFPCNALVEGRTCPLDVGFGLVVTIRARPDAVPAQGEMGVICALQRKVPLVTAGMVGRNPFAPWAVWALGRSDDLVAVVRAALGERARAKASGSESVDLDLRPLLTRSGERA